MRERVRCVPKSILVSFHFRIVEKWNIIWSECARACCHYNDVHQNFQLYYFTWPPNAAYAISLPLTWMCIRENKPDRTFNRLEDLQSTITAEQWMGTKMSLQRISSCDIGLNSIGKIDPERRIALPRSCASDSLVHWRNRHAMGHALTRESMQISDANDSSHLRTSILYFIFRHTPISIRNDSR